MNTKNRKLRNVGNLNKNDNNMKKKNQPQEEPTTNNNDDNKKTTTHPGKVRLYAFVKVRNT